MLILFDIAAVAFLAAFILTPLVRDLAHRLGVVDQPDTFRKMHAAATPRLGGLAVIAAYILACGFVLIAPYGGLTIDIPKALDGGIRLLPAVLLILITGVLDDIVRLRPWQKLVGQVAAALVAYSAGFGVYVFRSQPLELWISIPITVFWLVGCSNAFNLIDGLDGLAAGIGTFAALTTFVAALVHGHIELAIVTAPLVGSLLGFLRYNFNPASIFLGDCGSLTIGFLLGCYGALWGQKSATLLGMTAPLMALAVPLLDTGLAIIRRLLRNQPIFGADRSHIHHRLLDRGLTVRRVALLLYGVCGVGAGLSLLQEVAPDQMGGLIVVLFCVVTWIGIQHLGYDEFAAAGKLLFRGTLRGIIDTHVRMNAFESDLRRAETPESIVRTICDTARTLGFSSVRVQLPGIATEAVSLVEEPTDNVWEMRIPIAGGAYVWLTHHFIDAKAGTNVVLFAKVIENVLTDHMAVNTLKTSTRVASA